MECVEWAKKMALLFFFFLLKILLTSGFIAFHPSPPKSRVPMITKESCLPERSYQFFN